MSDSAKILVGKDASEVSKHLCDAVERLFGAREDKEAAFVIGLSGGSLPKFFAMGAKAMKVSDGSYFKIRVLIYEIIRI